MSTVIEPPVELAEKNLEEVETVTNRFAGDSGDGMQLTGTQFTNTSAVVGNDISTLPDFPAEIRAPAGSLPGVSGFQLNFSSQDIRTPGDQPNVLVAMNPAALKVNLSDLEEGGTLIINTGYNFADTTEVFTTHYTVKKAQIAPGKYRKITGNEATAIGFVAASQLAGRPLFYGSYPITPASDILHELARHKNFGVKTFQAEDEIAAVCAAIGASFAGHVGLTGTSGPGVALKQEAIGLAVMTELPLVIINVQRGGPSTGLPTKTEQADLFQAGYGRNGEGPIPVLAARSPADCVHTAYEPCRIATDIRMPAIV